MNQLTTGTMKGIKSFLMVFLLVFLLFAPRPVLSQAGAEEETVTAAETAETAEPVEAEPPSLTQAEIEKIEAFVQKQMKIAKIPGLSVVIVKENQTVYQKGFGFAHLKSKEPVTPATLFELASASKPFTALAVLQLEEKGLIKLDDPVDKYIPWLKMKYKGQEVQMTIKHLLHHSTGLQYFETLGRIPVSKEDDALEKAVQTLKGYELTVPPGKRYTYTSIAYSVLGFLIEKVSGQSYEEYIKKNILMPLQMNRTCLFREEAKGMATGYKICFNKPSAYDAPMFRGNKPGAYIMTNAQDLAQWLKIQMGTIEPGGLNKELIEKSHVPAPDIGCPNYAAGWFVLPNYRLITHGGLNPNFSAFIGFGDEKLGVGVLANMGTMLTNGIGQGIFCLRRPGGRFLKKLPPWTPRKNFL
jgi:putative ATP-binding cassette transporter